ncbi:MAG: hypothetical protein IPM98_19355 [Lewinellaceae bacterium]|nr:hypothetical protein [Lewinellaceae bacterium]
MSHAGQDLSLLGKIKITDYQMIDQVQDKQTYKKVIAQEVEEVFPQAVITSRRIIPNVYEQAGAFKFEHGVLTVTTTKAHDFAAGTEIDLVTPEGRLSNIHVTEVKDAHTFTVAAESAPSKVFVYGKYVDDFKSVDYDALSMLNISATQELYRLVQELQKENAALQAENGALRTQSAGVESRLARLEAMLTGGAKGSVVGKVRFCPRSTQPPPEGGGLHPASLNLSQVGMHRHPNSDYLPPRWCFTRQLYEAA